MRRRFLTLFAVAMTAIALLLPTFASAAELPEGVILDEYMREARSKFHFKRGCIETYISINAGMSHQDWIDGSTYDSSDNFLMIDQENTCTKTPIIGIDVYTEGLQADVSHKLNGASLRGDVMAHNFINEGGDVRIRLNMFWVAAGRVNSTSGSDEINASLPGGEQVPAIQSFTDYDRRAIALGVITIDNQIFPLFDRSDSAFIYGFDSTWTMVSQE